MEEVIYNIYALSIYIIGALFGSFFSLATYRIPRHQDIFVTRSYCPRCKHKLGFFDCFPILSYISTIGRCKYCQKPISIRYLLLEVINGFVFLLFFFIFGISVNLVIMIVCYSTAFVCIGSNIMEAKMTKEERAEVEKIKSNKKKGAINIDILVASIVFLLYIATTIYITRSYSQMLIMNIKDIDSMVLCENKLSEMKALNINDGSFVSNSGTEVIGKYEYDYSVSIYPYLKDGYISVPGCKVIEVTTTYVIGKDEYTTTLKAMKVEETYE